MGPEQIWDAEYEAICVALGLDRDLRRDASPPNDWPTRTSAALRLCRTIEIRLNGGTHADLLDLHRRAAMLAHAAAGASPESTA